MKAVKILKKSNIYIVVAFTCISLIMFFIHINRQSVVWLINDTDRVVIVSIFDSEQLSRVDTLTPSPFIATAFNANSSNSFDVKVQDGFNGEVFHLKLNPSFVKKYTYLIIRGYGTDNSIKCSSENYLFRWYLN